MPLAWKNKNVIFKFRFISTINGILNIHVNLKWQEAEKHKKIIRNENSGMRTLSKIQK